MIFRAYFNRLNEAPQVWSIDEGTQASEINVKGFVVYNCVVTARANYQKPNNDSPVAWIEIDAHGYVLVEGIAHFTRKAAE